MLNVKLQFRTIHFSFLISHSSFANFCSLVEMMGFEPMTPCLQGRCSPSWATPPNYWEFCFSPFLRFRAGRTTRFKLCLCTSVPCAFALVGPSGLEPPTSCLSGTRSNLLSYDPMWLVCGSSHSAFSEPRADFSALTLCWHWAIFPCRFQQSIFATAELNFCVRNGNRWTLCVCNTNLFQ